MAYNPIEVKTALTAAVENTQPSIVGLSALFPNEVVINSEMVELDGRYNKARVAEFVNPEATPDGTEKLSFKRTPFKLPTLQDLRSITGKDLKDAQFGVNPYNGTALMDVLASLIASGINDQRTMFGNGFGKMSVEAAFDGKITVVGKGENRILDFGRPAELLIDVGAADATQYWNNTGADVDSHVDAIIEVMGNYGGAPDIMVARPDVMQKFINNSGIAGKLDNRRVEFGGVTFQNLMNTRGMFYYGTYKGMALYGFAGTYYDKAGVLQKAVPANKVLFAASNNGNIAQYGDSAATLAEMLGLSDAITARDDMNFVSSVYLTENKKEVNIASYQCCAPMQADMGSFGVLKVLA